MNIARFDGRNLNKVFGDAGKLYAEIKRGLTAKTITPQQAAAYKKKLNEISKSLVMTTAREIADYEKAIDAAIKKEIRDLEAELNEERKRQLKAVEGYRKTRDSLCKEGVTLSETLDNL